MSSQYLKVLIADDSDTDRMILKSLIKKLGHEVECACDGNQAIEKLKKFSPDIILLDALMPNLDGFEAAPILKSMTGDDFIPIIFLTSLTDDQSLIKGLDAGGDDFLAKPYNINVMKSKINAFGRMRKNHVKLKQTMIDLEASQNRLVEREKMASLGELVAGIAHEVNTPIGVGVTSSSHMRNQLNKLQISYDNGTLDENDLTKFLENANESVTITETNLNRAADLIRSFKQVAVDQSSGKIRDIHIHQHIDDLVLSLRPTLKRYPHKIDIHCDHSLVCSCDAGALSQIVTNLIMNSINHAFAGNEAGLISIDVTCSGGAIHLVYKDNGCGMDSDNLTKIFEPFFTTKRGQGGSGLGTHIIYNQVTQGLHGSISVSSAVNEGIEFRIDFPASASDFSI